MIIYRVTDDMGREHNVAAESIDQALDLVSRDQGFIDHSDQALANDWDESPFDIEALQPEGAVCYWSVEAGEIVYRIPGHQHGDGQVDDDDNPVYLTTGLTDGEEDNVYNLNALPDAE